MTTTQLHDKIRKLLALGTSPERHEAEAALAAARRLAIEHGIDLASVRTEEQTLHRQRILPAPIKTSFARIMAYTVLDLHFRVSAIYGRGHAWVVGHQADTTIALYALAYMLRAHRAELSRFLAAEKKARRTLSRPKLDGFTAGYFAGICYRLDQETEAATKYIPSYALVLTQDDDARRARVKEMHPHLRQEDLPIDGLNRTAQRAGFAVGEQTRIRTALTA